MYIYIPAPSAGAWEPSGGRRRTRPPPSPSSGPCRRRRRRPPAGGRPPRRGRPSRWRPRGRAAPGSATGLAYVSETDDRPRALASIVDVRTHSTRLSSPWRAWSTGFRPVMSSSSTTPKENTSDRSVSFPLDAYSGASLCRYGLVSEAKTEDAWTGEENEYWTDVDAPKRPHDASGDMRVRVVGELGQAEICNLRTTSQHGPDRRGETVTVRQQQQLASILLLYLMNNNSPRQPCLCLERIVKQDVGGLYIPVDDPRVTCKCKSTYSIRQEEENNEHCCCVVHQ